MTKQQTIRSAAGIIALAALVYGVFHYLPQMAGKQGGGDSQPNLTGLPAIDPESVANIVKDPASGKEFVSNEVIVQFKPEVSEQEAITLIEGLGAKMKQRFTAAPIFLIQVKDPGDGTGNMKTVNALARDPRVFHVEPNYIMTIEKPTEGTAKPE
jgi:hypothetical protein